MHMPDKRRHRGKHPDDDKLFARTQQGALQSAVSDFAMLLTRGYADKSALKLVGDRYNLTARQRMAVWRSTCSDQALQHRRRMQIAPEKLRRSRLGIDGYNLLITVESALSGGLVLIGRDGCYRDLASIHGTYRRVEETQPAIELIIDHLARYAISRIDWYLDRPVSNSGRLKTLMAELLEQKCRVGMAHQREGVGTAHRKPGVGTAPQSTWNIELVNNPDAVLADYDGTVASSDSLVLDNCKLWTNLAAEIIDARIDGAWTLDLRDSTSSKSHGL